MIGRELRSVIGHEREDIVSPDGNLLMKARTPVQVSKSLFNQPSQVLGDAPVRIRPFVTDEVVS
ncbi:MAG: hypothetical protein IMW89_17765 [Ktedonobacteraceae bacterium]|nr:hypothetical protein [Ktedonobacteraceae bacterium]